MTLHIEGQRRSLKVNINSETGEFLFAGVSLPENTNSFFHPVLTEIEAYLTNPKEHTTINFFIEYLNTSSALFLRRIVLQCETALSADSLTVNWHYEKDDEDIQEFGYDFQSIFKKVKIEVKEISENPY